MDLPPAAASARICSYECTFCVDCVENVLENVCPNCGGGFQPRPIRPVGEWRADAGLAHDPPGVERRRSPYTREELAAFSASLREIPPGER